MGGGGGGRNYGFFKVKLCGSTKHVSLMDNYSANPTELKSPAGPQNNN
jgi:hypothetical protein